MRLPIRTRLTLVFAGVTLVVLAAAAAALLLGFRAELSRTVDEGLRALTFSMRDDPASRLSAVASDEVFAQYLARRWDPRDDPRTRRSRCFPRRRRIV